MPRQRKSEGQIRLSITIEPNVRKTIRIAAAYADMDVGEWAGMILKEAAERAIGADRDSKQS